MKFKEQLTFINRLIRILERQLVSLDQIRYVWHEEVMKSLDKSVDVNKKLARELLTLDASIRDNMKDYWELEDET